MVSPYLVMLALLAFAAVPVALACTYIALHLPALLAVPALGG